MLWRKHWQEMRWLFAFAAVALFALMWFLFNDLPHIGPIYDAPVPGATRPTYHMGPVPFVRSAAPYLNGGLPVVLFVSAILFGLGGLGHERLSGTASFTLSLPYTRRRMMLSRFGAGYLALAVLAVAALIGAAIWAATIGMGSEFALPKALMLAIGLIAGAGVVYAFTYLCANVTAHTVQAIATTLALLATLELGINLFRDVDDRFFVVALRQFDVPRLMSNFGLMSTGRFPWVAVVVVLVLTAAFLWVTVRWVERHDF